MAKVQGLVIKEMRYKDNSKILTVFTRELGKITVMARGACNPKSKLISNTELFFYNRYQLYRGKTFYYINDTDTINSFYPIRENMDRLMYGSYLLELIDMGLIEDQRNDTIFKLVLKGLEVLETTEVNFLKKVLAYEIKFISFLGYRPNFKKCTSCNREHSFKWKFSIREGGIICQECSYIDRNAYVLNEGELEICLSLLFSSFEDIELMNLKDKDLYGLHHILTRYILEKLEKKRFKSLDMYNSLILRS